MCTVGITQAMSYVRITNEKIMTTRASSLYHSGAMVTWRGVFAEERKYCRSLHGINVALQ
jgi:hypothetical protein